MACDYCGSQQIKCGACGHHYIEKPLTNWERRKVATLRRRQKHLAGVLEKETEPLSYLEAEEGALRWAIARIEGKGEGNE